MLKGMVLFLLSVLQALFCGYAMQDHTKTLADKAALALVTSQAHLAQVPATIPSDIKTHLINALAKMHGYPVTLRSKVKSIKKGVCVVEGDIHDHAVIAVDCDGKLIVCADDNFTECRDWQTNTDPSAFAWDYNRDYMIIGERNGHVTVLDHKNKQIVSRHKAHHVQNYLNQVESLALKDDTLLSAGGDGLVKLWDAKNYELKEDFAFKDPVKNAHLTRANQLITATKTGKIQVTDVERGTLIRVNQILPESISRMKLLQDPHVVLISHCNRISGYDIRQANLAFSVQAHDAPITTLDVQSVEQFASGSFDKTVKEWDVRILRNVADLTGHEEWIQSLSHGPDFWISGSRDTTIRIWKRKPLQEIYNLSIPLALQK